MPARFKSPLKILFPLFILCFSINVFAQGTTGRLEGTIFDPSGVRIPNAQVGIENEAETAGFKKSVTADDEGYFIFAEVPPGKYRFMASSTGFKTYIDYVEISADKVTIADVELCVGTCDPLFMDYEEESDEAITAEIRSSHKKTVLENLPRRTSFSSLLKIAPFVRPEVLAGGFQIDGSSGAENTFFIDGQEATNFKTGLLNANNDLPFEPALPISPPPR
jgi:hypothetical protein